MNNFELEQIVNQQLNTSAFSDYAPNGLQVEGREQVRRVITGVTACQALLDEAVKRRPMRYWCIMATSGRAKRR